MGLRLHHIRLPNATANDKYVIYTSERASVSVCVYTANQLNLQTATIRKL